MQRVRHASSPASISVTWCSGVPSPAAWVIGKTCIRSACVMCSTRASSRAPTRSILLMKISRGIPATCSACASRRVCGCTPSTAETTRMTASRTRRERTTSAMKSGWPGVSMRLTVRSPSANEATADWMVMPRARSNSSVSVWVVPASTLPMRRMTPVSKRRRSVRLVLPASTCARMPRLRNDMPQCLPEEASIVRDGRVHQGQGVYIPVPRTRHAPGCRLERSD